MSNEHKLVSFILFSARLWISVVEFLTLNV
jgi:hypothetical protein